MYLVSGSLCCCLFLAASLFMFTIVVVIQLLGRYVGHRNAYYRYIPLGVHFYVISSELTLS